MSTGFWTRVQFPPVPPKAKKHPYGAFLLLWGRWLESREMDCFDSAWEEWFATEHKYALGDKQLFERLIKPYACFVGIYIKLK